MGVPGTLWTRTITEGKRERDYGRCESETDHIDSREESKLGEKRQAVHAVMRSGYILPELLLHRWSDLCDDRRLVVHPCHDSALAGHSRHGEEEQAEEEEGTS